MRIVVDRMPDSPRDCLFSKYKKVNGHTVYVCSLREYILESDIYHDGFKCGQGCKDSSKCTYLALEY